MCECEPKWVHTHIAVVKKQLKENIKLWQTYSWPCTHPAVSGCRSPPLQKYPHREHHHLVWKWQPARLQGPKPWWWSQLNTPLICWTYTIYEVVQAQGDIKSSRTSTTLTVVREMQPEDQRERLKRSFFPQAIRILNEDDASGLHGGPMVRKGNTVHLVC